LQRRPFARGYDDLRRQARPQRPAAGILVGQPPQFFGRHRDVSEKIGRSGPFIGESIRGDLTYFAIHDRHVSSAESGDAHFRSLPGLKIVSIFRAHLRLHNEILTVRYNVHHALPRADDAPDGVDGQSDDGSCDRRAQPGKLHPFASAGQLRRQLG
jgi:hypothetical protein